jgi:hypothetical protein
MANDNKELKKELERASADVAKKQRQLNGVDVIEVRIVGSPKGRWRSWPFHSDRFRKDPVQKPPVEKYVVEHSWDFSPVYGWHDERIRHRYALILEAEPVGRS